MASVRFAHVYKRYGDAAPVIRDLNLEVHDGEFLVLVGPSGCGKTTALRMVAGLERVSAGEIFIGDRPVNDIPAERRDVAMVFQRYALFPHMSVYDNMAYSLKLRHLPKAQIAARVARAAALLEISDELDRRPDALSGGQQQRVALGRALVHEPQVFLMDEPLSSLDAQLRVQARAEIARLHQRVRGTTIYVTHDQVEAMTMGDRIAVMRDGAIQQLGMPQEVYDAPANLFVAGFIGSPAMDFFAARLRRAPDGVALVIGAGADARVIALSGPVATHLAAHTTADERPVIAGIRPEDLHLASAADDAAAGDAAAGDAAALVAIVELTEHLGNEQIVHLGVPGALAAEQTETTGVTARVGPEVHVRPGERVALRVDATKIHIFDPQTRERLG